VIVEVIVRMIGRKQTQPISFEIQYFCLNCCHMCDMFGICCFLFSFLLCLLPGPDDTQSYGGNRYNDRYNDRNDRYDRRDRYDDRNDRYDRSRYDRDREYDRYDRRDDGRDQRPDRSDDRRGDRRDDRDNFDDRNDAQRRDDNANDKPVEQEEKATNNVPETKESIDLPPIETGSKSWADVAE